MTCIHTTSRISRVAEYSAALNTVVKWEKEFSCELEKVITNGKVTMIKCSLCKKFKSDLNKMRSYTSTRVEGTKIALLRGNIAM